MCCFHSHLAFDPMRVSKLWLLDLPDLAHVTGDGHFY